MPTINKRIEELEKNAPKQTNHNYEKVIGWGDANDFETQYFRDGLPTTRAEYMAEAPKEPGKIVIDWGEPIPPGEADPNENVTKKD